MTMKQIEINKEEFKKLREEAGFKSDAELAEFLGIYSSTIKFWNNGRTNFPYYAINFLIIKKLEKKFDIDIYENLFPNRLKKINNDSKAKNNIYLKKFENLSLTELEAKNYELKKEFSILKKLINEMA